MVIHLSSKAADNSGCARGKGTTHSSGAGSIPRKWKGLRYKLPHINADGQPNLGYSPKAATVMLSPSGAKPVASNPTQVCVCGCVCVTPAWREAVNSILRRQILAYCHSRAWATRLPKSHRENKLNRWNPQTLKHGSPNPPPRSS